MGQINRTDCVQVPCSDCIEHFANQTIPGKIYNDIAKIRIQVTDEKKRIKNQAKVWKIRMGWIHC